MHFKASLLVGLLPLTALASPLVVERAAATSASTCCLTDDQANNLVKGFAKLLTAPQAPTFNATAKAILASDFTDTSDSINFLAGIPLNTTTFPSRDVFIAQQGKQPPIPTLTTLDVFHSCNKIAWRWIGSGIGSGALPVKGINTFLVKNPESNQIDASFSEFDNGAWLVDIGNPECKKSS